MVHALKKVHSLLKRGGVMIDMQEIPYWRWLGVLSPDGLRLIKSHVGRLKFEHNRKAFRAMSQIIDDGLFALEDERTFDAFTHADSTDDLFEFYTAPPDEETIQSLNELLEKGGEGAKVVVRQPTRMVLLRAIIAHSI